MHLKNGQAPKVRGTPSAIPISAAASIFFLLGGGGARADGFVDELVRRFADSNIEFQRATSDMPFLPVAWISVSDYQEEHFNLPNGSTSDMAFRQSSVSEGAFLPLPLGHRDALVFGEWLSVTRFDLENTNLRDFDVFSISMPIGWIRQTSRNWQLAAFIAPLGSTNHSDSWYWETLGGVFGRYTPNERLSWIIGAYADVATVNALYTPYVGATYTLNEHWSFDAVLPWPAINYAPNQETFFRLGVAPSGASWSVQQGVERPRVSLSVWNLGLHAEHRLFGIVWLGLEAGVSGLRGLSIVGGEFQPLETRMSNTAYASMTINLRPQGPL